jgi:hypothetical protein
MMNFLKMALDAAQDTVENVDTQQSQEPTETQMTVAKVVLAASGVALAGAVGYGIYRGVDYMTNRDKAPKASEAKKDEAKPDEAKK